MTSGQRRETVSTMTEVADDFEIFEACLRIRLRKHDVESGRGFGGIFSQPSENPELRRRSRLFEEMNEVSRRLAPYFPQANWLGRSSPALASEMADDGIFIAVMRQVLK